DKVNTAIVTLRSRSHNEKVVQDLQYFVRYYKQGKYQLENAYRQTPFWIEADTLRPQILGNLITIQALDEENFLLKTEFSDDCCRTQEYTTKTIEKLEIEEKGFEGKFKFDEKINLPFFNGIVHRSDRNLNTNEYFIEFANFDNTVAQIR